MELGDVPSWFRALPSYHIGMFYLWHILFLLCFGVQPLLQALTFQKKLLIRFRGGLFPILPTEVYMWERGETGTWGWAWQGEGRGGDGPREGTAKESWGNSHCIDYFWFLQCLSAKIRILTKWGVIFLFGLQIELTCTMKPGSCFSVTFTVQVLLPSSSRMSQLEPSISLQTGWNK